MTKTIACAVVAAGLSVSFGGTALANKGCTNVQSRCAIEVGGRCDPKTGKWEYGRNYGLPGHIVDFDACVARHQAAKKKK